MLADVVAVDVERWRRFDGRLERADELDGQRWALTLGRSLESRGDATWWRVGRSATVPELIGTVSIGWVGPDDDVVERTVPVTVDVVRSHGEVVATLTMYGTGLRAPEEAYAVTAPAPAPEGKGPAREACAVVARTHWAGFPGPVVDVRPQVPLDRVVGATVCLHDLVDLALEPDELLLTAAGSGGGPGVLMRLTADEPLEDHSPEVFVSGAWNSAGSLDMDYAVEDVSLGAGALKLSGKDWLVDLRGANLRVVVEQLG